MTLDPPTPLQWKSLQECVVVHRNQLDNNHNGDIDMNIDMRTATIDAAPLVAIIDKATGVNKVKPPFSNFSNEGGRYATIAAVVGITTNECENENEDLYDKDDEESFMEFMNLCPVEQEDDFIVPLSSSVRLVGIGRAVLRKFSYRVPSELCPDITNASDNDNVGGSGSGVGGDRGVGEYIDLEEGFNHGYEDNTPIVMAEFEPLVDNASVYSIANPDKVGEKGQKSYRKSPVHALSELNNIKIKVARMHNDRRRLVAGIRAARARLTLYDENLEDFDGLGALFGGVEGSGSLSQSADNDKSDDAEGGMSIDEFLATFKGNMMRIDPSELPHNQPSALEKLEAMENYGMNYFGAMSSIDDLTRVASEQLEPYYSERFREREEYDLEVSSFVAFRCLNGYADIKDISWSLQCTSSIERLNRAYEILVDHTWLLKKLAEKMVKELEECGEECTDLW
mmetsp:Transcript_3932/g.6013  ORF Transcript_3932/g.6013 Transcript_3932/m.6013 type:complete len:454 (+) Transcript_3932:371-1732(+)